MTGDIPQLNVPIVQERTIEGIQTTVDTTFTSPPPRQLLGAPSQAEQEVELIQTPFFKKRKVPVDFSSLVQTPLSRKRKQKVITIEGIQTTVDTTSTSPPPRQLLGAPSQAEQEVELIQTPFFKKRKVPVDFSSLVQTPLSRKRKQKVITIEGIQTNVDRTFTSPPPRQLLGAPSQAEQEVELIQTPFFKKRKVPVDLSSLEQTPLSRKRKQKLPVDLSDLEGELIQTLLSMKRKQKVPVDSSDLFASGSSFRPTKKAKVQSRTTLGEQGERIVDIAIPIEDINKNEATPANFKVRRVVLEKPTRDNLKQDACSAMISIFNRLDKDKQTKEQLKEKNQQLTADVQRLLKANSSLGWQLSVAASTLPPSITEDIIKVAEDVAHRGEATKAYEAKLIKEGEDAIKGAMKALKTIGYEIVNVNGLITKYWQEINTLNGYLPRLEAFVRLGSNTLIQTGIIPKEGRGRQIEYTSATRFRLDLLHGCMQALEEALLPANEYGEKVESLLKRLTNKELIESTVLPGETELINSFKNLIANAGGTNKVFDQASIFLFFNCNNIFQKLNKKILQREEIERNLRQVGCQQEVVYMYNAGPDEEPLLQAFERYDAYMANLENS